MQCYSLKCSQNERTDFCSIVFINPFDLSRKIGRLQGERSRISVSLYYKAALDKRPHLNSLLCYIIKESISSFNRFDIPTLSLELGTVHSAMTTERFFSSTDQEWREMLCFKPFTSRIIYALAAEHFGSWITMHQLKLKGFLLVNIISLACFYILLFSFLFLTVNFLYLDK